MIKKHELWSLGILGALIAAPIAAFVLSHPTPEASAGEDDNVTGWAWSDNIGWVLFNNINAEAGSSVDFGVSVAQNGDFSGEAWSSAVGWISFDRVDPATGEIRAGDPPGDAGGSGPIARLESTGAWPQGNVVGWARVLGASDGWDGWIRLDGHENSVRIDADGYFHGYAWGSDTYQPYERDGDGNIVYEADGVTEVINTDPAAAKLSGPIGWMWFDPFICGGGTPCGARIEDNTGDIIAVNVSADPSVVNLEGEANKPVQVTWEVVSGGPDECTLSGGWSGDLTPAEISAGTGTQTINLSSDTTFAISCQNTATGTFGSDSVLVRVVDFTAGSGFSLRSTNDISVDVASIDAGSTKNSSRTTLQVVPGADFSDTVSVVLDSCSGNATGCGLLSGQFAPDAAITQFEYDGGTEFYVTVPGDMPSGVYVLTLEGTGGSLSRTEEVVLRVSSRSIKFEAF